jgi:ParB/RepB/Spo0J family partition protein
MLLRRYKRVQKPQKQISMKTEVLKTKRKDRVLMSVSPANLIVKDGFNVRQDYGNMEELMTSILESGLQVPIKAKELKDEDDKWEVVDGHRRLKAIQMAIANGHEIPYVDVLAFKGNEEERVVSMLITGTGQKPLSEMEQANAVQRLINFGYRVDDIGRKMGRSLPHVYYLLKLAGLPMKIQHRIQEGYISGLTTMAITEKHPEDEWEERVEAVISKANENAPEGAIVKATAKHNEDRKLKPIEKLSKLVEYLNENEVENEKCSLLNELWVRLMEDESIDELVLIFES